MFQAFPLKDKKMSILDSVHVIQAEVSVPGKNKFGQAESAILKIRSPVLVFHARFQENQPDRDHERYEKGILTCADIPIPDTHISASFDYPESARNAPILGIPIGYRQGALYSKYHVAAGTLREGAPQSDVDALAIIHGLLVRPPANFEENVYERVGCFQIGWTRLDKFVANLDRLPIQDITIV